MSKKGNPCQLHTDHDGSLISELFHHLPAAILSVALGLVVLSFLDYFSFFYNDTAATIKGANVLFHSFHFLHLIFAATGSLITFSRFSSNMIKGLLIASLSTIIFCTLSDIVLPYCAGMILGVRMHLHICFFSEIHNVIPFLAIGLLNGFLMSQHDMTKKLYYSLGSHFGHILVSSLASLFYLVSEGFSDWYPQIGLILLLLIIAVVIPCTFADVIIPVTFAKK